MSRRVTVVEKVKQIPETNHRPFSVAKFVVMKYRSLIDVSVAEEIRNLQIGRTKMLTPYIASIEYYTRDKLL